MEKILMSFKERKRLVVFSRVRLGEMTLVSASACLGLSYRQTKRILGRYQEAGDVGLVHRSRGRASNRQSSVALKSTSLGVVSQAVCGLRADAGGGMFGS